MKIAVYGGMFIKTIMQPFHRGVLKITKVSQ